MKKVTQGSVLLTMFLILSSLTLLCCVVWRTATLTFDVAIKKQEFESYYQTTSACLNYTIELCKDNFETLQTYLKLHKDFYIEFPLKKYSNKNKQRCVLKTNRINDDTLALIAKLQEHEHQIYALSCLVVRTKTFSADMHDAPKDYFAVASWKKNGSVHHG